MKTLSLYIHPHVGPNIFLHIKLQHDKSIIVVYIPRLLKLYNRFVWGTQQKSLFNKMLSLFCCSQIKHGTTDINDICSRDARGLMVLTFVATNGPIFLIITYISISLHKAIIWLQKIWNWTHKNYGGAVLSSWSLTVSFLFKNIISFLSELSL